MSAKCRHCWTAELSDSEAPSEALCYCAELKRVEIAEKALTIERAALRVKDEVLCKTVLALAAAEARAGKAASVAADLEDFADHGSGCRAWQNGDGPQPCTCGLEEVVRRLNALEGPKATKPEEAKP